MKSKKNSVALGVLLVVALLVVVACDLGGSGNIARQYMSLSAQPLPDTVYIDTVTLSAKWNVSVGCSAPGTCWHDLDFICTNPTDSTYAFAAYADYVEGACGDALVVKDSIFDVAYSAKKVATPEGVLPEHFAKRIYFHFYSLGSLLRADTVVVASPRAMPVAVVQ